MTLLLFGKIGLSFFQSATDSDWGAAVEGYVIIAGAVGASSVIGGTVFNNIDGGAIDTVVWCKYK